MSTIPNVVSQMVSEIENGKPMNPALMRQLAKLYAVHRIACMREARSLKRCVARHERMMNQSSEVCHSADALAYAFAIDKTKVRKRTSLQALRVAVHEWVALARQYHRMAKQERANALAVELVRGAQ